jgi:hypothetical protein
VVNKCGSLRLRLMTIIRPWIEGGSPSIHGLMMRGRAAAMPSGNRRASAFSHSSSSLFRLKEAAPARMPEVSSKFEGLPASRDKGGTASTAGSLSGSNAPAGPSAEPSDSERPSAGAYGSASVSSESRDRVSRPHSSFSVQSAVSIFMPELLEPGGDSGTRPD